MAHEQAISELTEQRNYYEGRARQESEEAVRHQRSLARAQAAAGDYTARVAEIDQTIAFLKESK